MTRPSGARSFARALVAAFSLGALLGCDRPPAHVPPASQPAARLVADSQPAVASTPTNPILPESLTWTREEALAKLPVEETAVCAAVRLLRLADVAAPELPDPLPLEVASRVRVCRISRERHAVGLAEDANGRRLDTPRVIDAAGAVEPPGEGAAWTLYVARDPDVFPHLFVAPDRVLNAADLSVAALVLTSPKALRFDLRFDDGIPYVALLLPSEAGAAEVARYTWDPYEAAFLGPATDRLPDPPGGRFQLDLEASAALQPVGGLIEEPDRVTEPPDPRPPGDDDLPPPY